MCAVDGFVLVTCMDTGTVRAFDILSQQPISSHYKHQHSVSGIVRIPHSSLFVTCDRSGLIVWWNYVTGCVINEAKLDHKFTTVTYYEQNNQLLLGTESGVVVYVHSDPQYLEIPLTALPLSREQQQEESLKRTEELCALGEHVREWETELASLLS